MCRRWMLTTVLALTLCAGATPAGDAHALGSECEAAEPPCHLESTIALTSTRDDPTASPPILGAEVYLLDPDGTDARRLTDNADGDGFPALSPDGKKIVFDSNRNRTSTEPVNTSDLFLMKTDGREQQFLARGSSATWSPDGKLIAFHASASGTGLPIRNDPGSATSDSDIFTARVGDLLDGLAVPTNLTHTSDEIEDDADWSPNGAKIVFTSHPKTDHPQFSNQAEIYVMNADGTGRLRLTDNGYEERAPSWSPDGVRIVFSCRIDGGMTDFEICVVNADGTGFARLTDNAVGDLTATWSPDGTKLLFHRTPQFELWVMDPDGTSQAQLTDTAGSNGLASWGELWAPQALMAPGARAGSSTDSYYLALGDSLAQGYQPTGGPGSPYADPGYGQGYPEQLRKLLRDGSDHLRLVNLACGGETTTTMIDGSAWCGAALGAGSQLAEATAFLRAHRGDVALVTIDIGGNDVSSLDGGGIEAVVANVPTILAQLREAAGPAVPIVGMSYYDPFLPGVWFGTHDPAALQDEVDLLVRFNDLLEGMYAAAGDPVADVEGAFSSTDLGDADGDGVPDDVERVCEWTWGCTPPPLGPDIHPNTQGHAAIARAFADAVGAA